ncbi:MAG: hypothetical protein GY759_15760 [Chloroflexi bacterium]|nr:hypothetical protein [Chloroflexota bacterium]
MTVIPGLPVYWPIGLLVYRPTGLPVYRSTGLLAYRPTGLLAYRSTDLQTPGTQYAKLPDRAPGSDFSHQVPLRLHP